MFQRCLFGLLVLITVAGCGLKGPLYRPDEPQPAQTVTGEAAQDNSDSKKLQRPRPSPQAQKEAHADEGERQSTVPPAPVGQDNADTQPLPADESR